MANPRIFENSIQIPVAPTSGFVLTSDSVGKAAWAAPPASTSFVLDGGSSTTVATGTAKIDCGASV